MTASADRAETLRAKLAAAFDPDLLEVVDESEQHRGHAGWREGGGTHFRVTLRARALDGLSRVERSRSVHRVLQAELEGGVHALALDLGGSGEGRGNTLLPNDPTPTGTGRPGESASED